MYEYSVPLGLNSFSRNIIYRYEQVETNVHFFFSFQIYISLEGELSDSFTNYNYVGNTKVSVSIKKILCQQMHIKRDISN